MKKIAEFSKKIEKLKREKKSLEQKLKEARENIDLITAGAIDAVIVGNKNDLKVYTETTADKAYRILIERMHEGAATVNKNGTILYCNSFFSDLVNEPLQKVIGTQLNDFIEDSSKESFKTLLKKGWENYVSDELYIHASDDKDIPVLMSVNTLLVENESILSIIITDLTLRKKNQKELKRRSIQLEQINLELGSANKELTFQNEKKEKRAAELDIANKDLTSFTYVSSHDLQEPLRKIQTFVALMLTEENKNLSKDGKNYLQRTYDAAKQMRALIEDLLIYSRAKNTERQFEKTNLNIILESVKKDFEEVIQERKAQIKAGLLCKVNIIRFQFRQLMFNLISNSLKFSKPGVAPIISINTTIERWDKLKSKNSNLPDNNLPPEMEFCHMIYTDNGIGFDAKHKDRIFEVFQRLHNKEDYPGTGMGLAICKRIVENHNGYITAIGEINKGARFDIFIPIT